MSDKPRKLAVLMGGPSAEREVSLRTGAAVAGALREAGYEVEEITVDHVGKFEIPPGTDLAFLAMHGTFGEDGQVQDILTAKKIPFTGANAAVSRICIDKDKTKAEFTRAGVPVPQGQLVARVEDIHLPLPLFIKPNTLGSSVGSAPVHERAQLAEAFALAARYGTPVLVERFIKGKELTVGVLGDTVLPIIEIKPLEGFYDYTNKYTKGKTEYLCPAPIDATITAKIQAHAFAAHRAVGRAVYSRIDFLLEDNGAAWCLEINTIPGMTATSLLPKAAGAVGITFPELCRRIVELSWEERRREGLL